MKTVVSAAPRAKIISGVTSTSWAIRGDSIMFSPTLGWGNKVVVLKDDTNILAQSAKLALVLFDRVAGYGDAARLEG